MKGYFAAAMFLAASIVGAPAVPVYIMGRGSEAASTGSTEEIVEYVENSAVPEAVSDYTGEPYKVLDTSTGKVLEVPERDYVIGAVCAEMPASFSEEAIKAQAVAAHTYAERQRIRERSAPTDELKGADFSNDTSKYQGFFTNDQIRQFFGENYVENYSKISSAVDEVLPYILTYGNEPIISAFHSMSPGKTESAENAWGAAVDYLVPVDSGYDTSAPKFLDEVRFSRDELKTALETAFSGIELPEDPSQWINVEKISDSGTVLEVKTGNMKLTGNDLRTALKLRSACFEVRTDGEEFVFTTRGYGHGVGMSQYGANSMAAEGCTWREILRHYYPGCTISG